MSRLNPKLPATLAVGVICLALGVAAGVGVMTVAADGKKADAKAAEESDKETPAKAGGKGGGGKGGGKGAFGGKGGGKGGGAGRAPGPKVQLAQLVTKLDTLTRKPLSVQLSAEEKQKAKDLLADLDAKDELTDDDARAKLDALLKLLEGHKEPLEAAGFRWPGSPAGGPRPPGEAPPNPFKAGEDGEHLKSLQATLGR